MDFRKAFAALMTCSMLLAAPQQPAAPAPAVPAPQTAPAPESAAPAATTDATNAPSTPPADALPKISKQTFKVQLNNALGTATSKVDDEITAVVMEPPDYLGWQFVGKIKKVTPAKKGTNRPAELEFQFETLAKNASLIVPVHADVVEVANTKGVKGVDEEGNVIGGVSNKKKAAGGVGGGLLGAGVGFATGGFTGMAIGAAAGAIVGYALVKMTTKAGSDIRFEKGAVFTLEVNSHRPAAKKEKEKK